MTNDELLKEIREAFAKREAESKRCPSCGHCPTCGHTPYRFTPYVPYIPPYHTHPWTIYASGSTTGGTTKDLTITDNTVNGFRFTSTNT